MLVAAVFAPATGAAFLLSPAAALQFQLLQHLQLPVLVALQADELLQQVRASLALLAVHV